MRLTDHQLLHFLIRHEMRWEVAPEHWNTGIPLGNGHIGALIWGDGDPLKITLDKYDCWELREQVPDPEVFNYEHLRELVEAGEEEQCEWDLNRAWRLDDKPHPTRLPMPRVEIYLPMSGDFRAALSLYHASVLGRVGPGAGEEAVRASPEPARETDAFSAWIADSQNLLMLRLHGWDLFEVRDVDVRVGLDHLTDDAKQTLGDWGYEEPERGRDGDAEWLRLRFPGGGEYVVAWQVHEIHRREFLVAIAVLSHNDADDPRAEAVRLVREAADRQVELWEEHAAWWAEWWRACLLTIPDPLLENLFYAEMYKLGCCSRPGGLPITLQALWTADGVMPPWSGDYHLDMNVEESYWPVYASNHLEAGEPLYETFSACLPRWREDCRSFFGFDGIWSGCAIAPDGSHVHGYHGVEFWPGNAAWLAHHYWLHWLYSRDEEFLREQALPMMRGAMQTYMNLLEPDEDGTLHIPLGYSPEWGEGSIARYGPDPACDIALIRWLGESLLAAADRLGIDDPERDRWEETLELLADYPRGDGGLRVTANDALWESHRHHSHLMAIHPLGVLNVEQGDGERALIHASILQWIRQGTGHWTGWSFPWASLIASRTGLGNMAWDMLQRYRAFITPNTFHVNGDYRAFGHSHARYSPMTLEAGFCAAAAIMEMLLQSWGGVIRLFPTVPDCWGDAYFEDLRAEGAFLVGALLAGGKVRYARILSEAGEPCRLRNPWPQSEVTVRGPSGEETLSGLDLQWETTEGGEYLVFPAGRPPEDDELRPELPQPSDDQCNWFGVQQPPRF